MKYREAKMELFLSDARGVYIPRDFAQSVVRSCVTGVSEYDYAILEAGPDSESYWDVWADVCDNAELTDPKTGTKYRVYQDDDCWLVEEGAKYNENPSQTGIDTLFYVEMDES